jgi:succinate dehydrogenase/fumarate reductase flavoprotein subunit
MNKDQISRRDFLKNAGAVVGGTVVGTSLMGLSGCATTGASGVSAQDVKWDRVTDVVVVGFGGAGAATAITAHDEGAEVLVLEKTETGGGNTSVSGGGVLNPNDLNSAITYFKALYEKCLTPYDDEVVQVFTEESMKNIAWLQSLDNELTMRRYGGAGFEVAGAESIDRYMAVPTDGTPSSAFLFNMLKTAVEGKRGIEVLYNTPGQRLITDSNGAVIGVVATQNGNDINIKARRGVVLTTGGFEYDQTMLRNFIKGAPIYATGWPGNTGDGIRMAQAVGADIHHMTGSSCMLGKQTPDFPSAFTQSSSAIRPNFIWVNKDGKRFASEIGIESHAGLLVVDWYDHHSLQYPQIPFWYVFDETRRLAGGVCSAIGGYVRTMYTWSSDNSAELAKGWIVQGQTLAELAGKINVPADVLQATVAEWNADVASGEDKKFHRPANSLGPIQTSPFYAIDLYPVLLNTQGGPRRNAKAQIVNPYDEPIPRLYSSGEMGCMWGVIYQGSGNLAEAFVFGRIAGKNVAAETPLD